MRTLKTYSKRGALLYCVPRSRLLGNWLFGPHRPQAVYVKGRRLSADLRGDILPRMPTRVVVLGAGFGGLELTTILSDAFGDAIDIVLIDKGDAFVFGFSKLDVMFGRQRAGRRPSSLPRHRQTGRAISAVHRPIHRPGRQARR